MFQDEIELNSTPFISSSNFHIGFFNTKTNLLHLPANKRLFIRSLFNDCCTIEVQQQYQTKKQFLILSGIIIVST